MKDQTHRNGYNAYFVDYKAQLRQAPFSQDELQVTRTHECI